MAKIPKTPKFHVKKVEIQKVHVGRQMVLRSHSKLVRKCLNRLPNFRLRNCFVAIEPNFAALSLQWLERRPAPPPPQRNQINEAGQSGSVNIHPGPSNASNIQSGTSNIQAAPIQKQRRASMASCRNIFEVDGTVQEFGFDYLHRVPRTDTVIGLPPDPIVPTPQPAQPKQLQSEPSTSSAGSSGPYSAIDSAILEIAAMPEDLAMQKEDDNDDFDMISLNFDSDSDVDEADMDIEFLESNDCKTRKSDDESVDVAEAIETGVVENGDAMNRQEDGVSNHFDNSKKVNVNHVNSGNNGNNLFDSIGSFGRSIQFDPFLRTRNVPFRIAGRRHSISVFNTIEEGMETMET